MGRFVPGRKPFVPDKRDFRVAQLEEMIEAGTAVPVTIWPDTEILDQGQTPECVSAGILGMLNTDDEQHNDPHFKSSDIHPFFITIPGSGPDGAEVRNGLKQAKANGWISAYAQLNSLTEIRQWLQKHGPVLVGTEFTSDMENPDSTGLVHPTGSILGGHEWFINGDDDPNFDDVNSWGTGWGVNGKFRISFADFDKLLVGIRSPGEAWAAVQPAVTPTPTPTPTPKPPANVFLKAIIKMLKAIIKEIEKWLTP